MVRRYLVSLLYRTGIGILYDEAQLVDRMVSIMLEKYQFCVDAFLVCSLGLREGEVGTICVLA